MSEKKRSPRTTNGSGPVMVILEEIRSQNRATIEAVQESRATLEAKIDAQGAEHRAGVRLLQGAVQAHSTDIRQVKGEVVALKEQLARLESSITADYRERLHRLEVRVDALERHSA